MVSSIAFLVLTYWADLSTTLASKTRMFVVGFIVLCQIALLLVFKLYFFKHVSAGGHADIDVEGEGTENAENVEVGEGN